LVSVGSSISETSQENILMKPQAAPGTIKINAQFSPTEVGGASNHVGLFQLFLLASGEEKYIQEKPCHPTSEGYSSPVEYNGLPAGTYRVTVSASQNGNIPYGARTLKGYYFSTSDGRPPQGGSPTAPDSTSNITLASGQTVTKEFKKSW
jgi:hypothetical protein